MTAHPIDTDRLLARIARLEAQSDIRGRAVVMYRERAREAETERDEWRQTALDERAAALDALEQIKVRDARAADIWDEAHEVGWNNADEYWRCDGLIPAYHKADTYPNPYRASETA